MHDLFLQNFLKAFVAIDPISLIPILTIITQGLNTKKTIKLSGFVFLITCSVIIFFSLYGNSFLVFMGISISSFQIIGGFFPNLLAYIIFCFLIYYFARTGKMAKMFGWDKKS